MAPTKRKKPNMQDATLVNIRALKKRVSVLERKVARILLRFPSTVDRDD